MSRGNGIRFLSVALALALAFSGLIVLGAALAESSSAAQPMAVGEEDASVTESGPAARDAPSTPMSREEMRAWAEKMGLPRARITYQEEEIAMPLRGSDSAGVFVPTDEDEIVIQKADQAHALGFDGTGVRVAVIDTGQDFAHPDLYNVTFRVTDAGSDYFLHPVVYDGASLNDYLVFGDPSPIDPWGANYFYNSWYVNTTYTATVVDNASVLEVNWTDGVDTFVWNVTGVSGLAAGEEVRIGFHPDDAFLFMFGVRPGLILYNDTGSGAPFDSVMADLDVDLDMGDEKRAFINTDWGSFDPEAELLFQDLDGDTVQDVSGGLLAFISDGVREIPYASRQIDVLNWTFQTLVNDDTYDAWEGLSPGDHLVPGDGDLVILHGDFEGPGSLGAHGTWVTSAIAGQGITGGGSDGPVLSGEAPGVKIIGSGNNFGFTDPFGQMGLYTALVFATEGYDGFVDTGDEAHIASNSWGGADWTGWDWSSRFADYVSTVHADERTLFVFSAGNSGPGYGGRSTPSGGASLLVSGSMENYMYRVDPWFMYDAGPNPAYGDVTFFSNRGPSAMGRHFVDALTTGQFGYGADPLNNNPFTPDDGDDALNGSASWFLWSGTSLSTPNLAGVTALIYDAYEEQNAVHPLAGDAKRLVKNTADDARVDPFMAGAGMANALRGVEAANETDGLTLDIHEWYPGDYHGTSYAAYSNLMFPGDSDNVDVTLFNNNQTASLDVNISDAVMAMTDSVSYSFTRTPFTAPDVLLLNDTGLYAEDGTLLNDTTAGSYTPADAVRVSMWFDRGRMDEWPTYLLRLFDWTDDGNGSYDGSAERNLMVQDWMGYLDIEGPNGFAFVHDPANRTHDGLIIYVNPALESYVVGDLDLTVQVDFFERMDFPWLSSSSAMETIGAGLSTMVTLTVDVPAETDPGLYEAVYLFEHDTSVTTLPVVVNVASDDLPMAFGGNSDDYGPYQQGVQYGSIWNDGSDSVASGDFRYYFLDLAEATDMTVLLEWDDADSSTEIYVLSNVTDWFSEDRPARYGPGTQEEAASKLAGSNTSSVTASLNAGLSIIVVRSTFLAGVDVAEHPIGQAGVIDLDPSPWIGVGVPVDGSETFTITSDIDFPDLQSLIESGLTIAAADTTTFTDETHDYFLTFDRATSMRVDLDADVNDLDLYVYWYDPALGGFVLQDASTSPDSHESVVINNPPDGDWWVEVHAWSSPTDTPYTLFISVVQEPFFTVTTLPDSLDAGEPAEVVIEYSLPHKEKTFGGSIYIGSAQFPRAIEIVAALTPDLPPLFSGATPSDGAVITDPSPTLSIDMRDAPDAFETEVDLDSVEIWLNNLRLTSLADIQPDGVTVDLPWSIADGAYTVMVEADDETGSHNETSWSLTLDANAPSLVVTAPTTTLTSNPEVTIAGEADFDATVTVNGTAVSLLFGAFSTTLTLSEGTHAIPVVASDAAGNTNTVTVDITVDLTAPSISISAPSDGATVAVPTVTVSGSTEAGATLVVNGLEVAVDPDGDFSVEVALAEGANTITATATDPAGNSASDSVDVTFANPVPGLEEDLDAAEQDLLATQDSLAITQILLYVVTAIAIVAVGGAGFLLYRVFVLKRGG